MPLQLTRGEHIQAETSFLGYLKSQVAPQHREKLCCYYVPAVGRFCVGVWVNRDRGLVIELFNYATPAELTQHDVHYVRYWFSQARFAHNEQRRALLWQEARQRDRNSVGKATERADQREHAVRQLNIHQRGDPTLRYA